MLFHAARGSRPDIAFACHAVPRSNAKPTNMACAPVQEQKMLRFVNLTFEQGILNRRDCGFELSDYCDFVTPSMVTPTACQVLPSTLIEARYTGIPNGRRRSRCLLERLSRTPLLRRCAQVYGCIDSAMYSVLPRRERRFLDNQACLGYIDNPGAHGRRKYYDVELQKL